MRRNRVDLITLGCSKNLVDSERLMRQFTANGYTVHHDSNRVSGEIVVINTCGFIGDAKEESVNMILEVIEAKRVGRVGKVIVMGCLSERYRTELQKEIPEVDAFYGKFDWAKILADLGKSYYADERFSRSVTTPGHYAYLKISEGCNRHCSYCAIPLITGKYVSRPADEIIEEVRQLQNHGVKELQLIAQDLTYYGLDLPGRRHRLSELVSRISDVNGIDRIRLHYAYPQNFPYDLLPVMRERKNICNYLDIALQHISDPMLQKMNRGITKAETYDLIARMRDEVPGLHLRTTLMTGHPGETEQDFEELMQFVDDIRFERLGAFVYSHEEGTYCDKHYTDDIPLEVKQTRLDRLMLRQQEIAAEMNAAKVGQVLDVILDRCEENVFYGRTEFDSPDVDGEVIVRPDGTETLKQGSIYPVRITSASTFELYGVPVIKP